MSWLLIVLLIVIPQANLMGGHDVRLRYNFVTDSEIISFCFYSKILGAYGRKCLVQLASYRFNLARIPPRDLPHTRRTR